MRKVFLVLVVGIIILNAASAWAVENYLSPTQSKADKVYVKPGDPVVADIVLEKTGIIPENASLNYSTELTSPEVRITIDGGEPQRYGVQNFELPLPSAGVDRVEIRVTGNAPEVETQTEITVIELKTLVNYKGEPPQYQDSGKITVRVSTAEISEAKDAINQAKSRYVAVKELLDGLEAKGIDVVPLKARLADARVQIDTADALFQKGDQELAKNNADAALNALTRIEDDARGLDTGVQQKSELKKYLIIGAAVIIVLIVFLIAGGKSWGRATPVTIAEVPSR
ncbi:MAG: hypothetical protein GXO65_06965 [Euryarchaeota archaeon]|nr:hypothetical protein [Euryarchaeota archaeon]